MNWPRPIGLDVLAARRVPRLGLAVLMVGVGLIGERLWHFNEARGGAHDARSQRQSLDRQLARAPVATVTHGARPWIAVVNHDLGQPWASLLHRLEAARGASITLVSVNADAQSGRVTIVGQAGDFAAIAAYVRKLADAGLREALVTSHQTEPGVTAVRFSVTGRWATPTPGAARSVPEHGS